jgi:hypothetical protein
MENLRRIRPDLLLLLSLVLMILLHPILDHGTFRRLFMEVLVFAPVVLATVTLSEIKAHIWPPVVLMAVAILFAVAGDVFHNSLFVILKWWVLAAYFAFAVVGLFGFLRKAGAVTESHLYTAVSIYLLLGMVWYSVYCAIDTARPGSVMQGGAVLVNRTNDLLYFSLITLATIGYGDLVPVDPEVRMLAALEGLVGVLYIAITVAILVSKFRTKEDGQ